MKIVILMKLIMGNGITTINGNAKLNYYAVL